MREIFYKKLRVTLTIGDIQIGYAYGIYGLNENLLQHEISVKIRFAGRKKMG